ncbi:GNAT family N-acetyltransferase [uncultured Actinomyces sp.]|uniref:GNAT family N-acetyltransferase n=1 Tax=uncultured Actinomyces sp. TaxID=249061 RepID=UPI0028DB0BA6|nr:GNAT family N-acetyltransferase [uncultured Actinomyces sp.]
MSVELVTSSTPELVEAMERLIPQLSRTAPALTAQQCADLVAQPGVFLFVFRPDADAPTGAASQVGSDGQGAAGQAGPGAQGAGTAAGAAAPILGMLTLATFTIPTGLRAWVEDVVVDGQARGRGAGQALVEAAVAHATSIGARTVDLTSRPSREAANRLYRRAGFELRETNVYRYKQS